MQTDNTKVNNPILLIEDDKYFRKTLINLLRKEGYDVTDVENGYQAVERAKTNDFALIITDVRLPGIDGIETLERIWAVQPELRKKIIVITGYTDSEVFSRALKVGIIKFLFKPFSMKEFIKSVEDKLAQVDMQ